MNNSHGTFSLHKSSALVSLLSMSPTLRLFVPALLFIFAPATSSRAGEPAKIPAKEIAASPYAAVETFVGGVWVATLPPNKAGQAVRLELRFAWSENHQGVRFDSAWVIGEKRAPYTSGQYAWDAAKKKLIMFYTDSGASLVEGPMTPDGNAFVHDLTATDKDGKVEPIRVKLTKAGADAFTNEIFTMKDGAMAKLVEVRYERSH